MMRIQPGTLMKSRRIFVLLATLALFAAGCEQLLPDPDDGDIIGILEDSWRVEEESQVFGNTRYIVEIERHPLDSSRIYVDNFYNVDAAAEVTVSGRNLSITDQVMDGGYRVYGSGTLSGDNESISWQYTVDDGSGQLDNITAVYTRL